MTQTLEMEKETEKKFKDDPVFSAIVPAYNLKPDILKRCLLSLQDQNYKNLEVVVVLDGPNEQLKKVAQFFVDQMPFWKVMEIEHKGACAARNAGFYASSGEIVAFINSDYVINRGIIRLWVDSLLEHPECGFVYGGYEYASENRLWYPSKEFDPWLLKIANYIDCGFPLWRKFFVPWDENCKSLQDWDFWLRVIETHRIKGHFMGRDVSFVAELPRAGGLSMDSSNNWLDRVGYIKSKNKIPAREMVVTSIGAGAHGVEIAKLLRADYRDDTLYKPNAYKALYLIGYFVNSGKGINEHPAILAHFKDAKKIVHFIGADIYWLRKLKWEDLRLLAGAFKVGVDKVLCETLLAQQELAAFGIEAEIVPIPSYSDIDFRGHPMEFKVATFMTDKSDFDKYCKEETLSIIRAMPDVKFSIYGDHGQNLRYPNCRWVGNLSRKDWEAFIYDHSCLLRLVRHDTLPLAATEFLMAGRPVVTNINHPFATYIDTAGKEEVNKWDHFQPGLNAYNWPDTKKQIVHVIRDLKRRPSHNKNAAETYRLLLDKDHYREKIYGFCGLEVPNA